jgi:hypothetical protein
MKIAESKEGNQILLGDNGTPKNCPFQPAQLYPGKLQGQVVENHKPCGNWCPFFQYSENGEKKILHLECTGTSRNFGIKEVIKDKINLKSI